MEYRIYPTSDFMEANKDTIPEVIADFLKKNKELSSNDITTIPYIENICYKTIHRRFNLWFITQTNSKITLYIPRAIEDRSYKSYFNTYSREDICKNYALTEREKDEINNVFSSSEPKEKEKMRPDMEIFEGIRDFSDSSTSFVYEMYDWTIHINDADNRDYYSSIFKTLKKIILQNEKEDKEENGWKIKGIDDDSHLQIIYRINYGINSKYFFLYDIIKDTNDNVHKKIKKLKAYTDKSIEVYIKNADNSLSDEDKKLYAEWTEFGDDNLKKQAQKGYPDLIMCGELKDWKKIENDEDANLALSEEEIKVLQETHYPCFLNGLAGSGKTTILYYLFVNAFLYQISLPETKIKKMIFLSQSEKLVVSAKNIVTALGTTNYKRWTTKNTTEGETKIKNQLNGCFKSFKQFLWDNYLTDELQNKLFIEDKYIDYKKFTNIFAKWPLTDRKISPEKVWSVIRSFIKGKDYKKDLSVEDYENLISDNDKTVDKDEYKKIFEIYEQYYSKLKSEKYWDDLDMVSHILKKIEYNNPYEQYDVIFCDEAQDFTPIEILLILKSSKYYNYNLSNFKTIPIAFAGDPNQTISPTGFNWSRMKDIFTNSFKEQIGGYIRLSDVTLNNNYRSKSNIIRLSNSIQYLRGLFTKNNYLEPQNEWNVTENPIPGFIEITDNRKAIINSVLKSVDFIITGDDGEDVLKDETLNKQEEDRLYTPASSKGLEANTVILYKFVNAMPDCFSKIFENRDLNSDDIFACEYFITKLYVAITRAREILYIVDTTNNFNKFWKYFINNDFINKTLNKDNKRKIWLSKVGGIEKPLESEFDNNAGESKVEKRIRELSNRTAIAERIFNNAKYGKDIALMKRAKGYFSLCKANNRMNECDAYICRYEGNYEQSGSLFWRLSQQREAITSYWIGQCWTKLSEYTDDERRYFANYCLDIINLIDLISILSENEEDWTNKYNMSDETWIAIIEKIRKDALTNYGTNNVVLEFIEKILEKKCGLSYLEETIAELYFQQKKYTVAINKWEKIGKTEYKNYYIAQKALAIEKNNHNDIIKWENNLHESDLILKNYKSNEAISTYKLNNDSQSIIFHTLLKNNFYIAALNYKWNNDEKYDCLYYADKNQFLVHFILNDFNPQKYRYWIEDKVKIDNDLGMFNEKIDQSIFKAIFEIENDWMLFLGLRDNKGNRLFFKKDYNCAIINSIIDILQNKKHYNKDKARQLALCLLDALFGEYYNLNTANNNISYITDILQYIEFNRKDFYEPIPENYFFKCNKDGVSIIKKNFSNFITETFKKEHKSKTFEKYCQFYEKILNDNNNILNFYNMISGTNKVNNACFINFRIAFYQAVINDNISNLNDLLIDNNQKNKFLSYLDRDDTRIFVELVVKDNNFMDNEAYTIANLIYQKNIKKENYKNATTHIALKQFVNRNIDNALKQNKKDYTLIKLLCHVYETIMENIEIINWYNNLIKRNDISTDLKEYFTQKIEQGSFGKNRNIDIKRNNKPRLTEQEKLFLQKIDELQKAKEMVEDSYDSSEIIEQTGLPRNIIKVLKLLKRNTNFDDISKETNFSVDFIKRLNK